MSARLLESGDFRLLEDGGLRLLEEIAQPDPDSTFAGRWAAPGVTQMPAPGFGSISQRAAWKPTYILPAILPVGITDSAGGSDTVSRGGLVTARSIAESAAGSDTLARVVGQARSVAEHSGAVLGFGFGVRVRALNAAQGPPLVAAYEEWVGRPVEYWTWYGDQTSTFTAMVTKTTNECNEWAARPEVTFVVTLPMLMTGDTFDDGIAGDFDTYFADVATALQSAGRGDSIVNLGWEFNGDWYEWSVQSLPVAAKFVTYYQRLVGVMRAEAPNLRFAWTPSFGGVASQAVTEACWPGDSSVDYVGLTIYDRSPVGGDCDYPGRWDYFLTDTFGLEWQRDFAAAHSKPLAFTEWGLIDVQPGGCDADDPQFISNMYDWFVAEDVGYASYFEVDSTNDHALNDDHFPDAAAEYLSLFGGMPTPDTLTRGALVQARTVADSAAGADTLTQAFPQARAIADNADGSDAVARGVLVLARALADSAAGSDITTGSASSGTTRSITDAADGSDAVSQGALTQARPVADNADGSDALARAVVVPRAIADSAAGSDAIVLVIGLLRAVADSAAGSDTVAQGAAFLVVRAITDVALGADTLARVAAYERAVTDSAYADDHVDMVLLPAGQIGGRYPLPFQSVLTTPYNDTVLVATSYESDLEVEAP